MESQSGPGEDVLCHVYTRVVKIDGTAGHCGSHGPRSESKSAFAQGHMDTWEHRVESRTAPRSSPGSWGPIMSSQALSACPGTQNHTPPDCAKPSITWWSILPNNRAPEVSRGDWRREDREETGEGERYGHWSWGHPSGPQCPQLTSKTRPQILSTSPKEGPTLDSGRPLVSINIPDDPAGALPWAL